MSLVKLVQPLVGRLVAKSAGAPAVAARSPFTLRVLSGLHQGASVGIAGPSCSIGSSGQCDVLLTDPAIAPDHLHLRLYGKDVAVDAVGGDAQIKGHGALPMGNGRRLTLPVQMTLGTTRIVLARTGGAGPKTNLWIALGGAGLLLVALPLALPPIDDVGGSRRAPAVSPPADAPRTGSKRGGDMAGVVGELRADIASATLSMLNVRAEDGRIAVSGYVPASKMADWRAIEQRFDGRHGDQYQLVSQVREGSPPSATLLGIQGIWLGDPPYVIDARGERRQPGATLGDGWTLKAIAADRLIVSKDGFDVALTL